VSHLRGAVQTALSGSGFKYYVHGYFPDPGTAYLGGFFYDNLGTLAGIGAEGGGECCGAYYVTVLAADTPEPSTWSMLLVGFAAIGFAGYQKSRSQRAVIAVGAVHVVE
jgi:PEP-CTERM motif